MSEIESIRQAFEEQGHRNVQVGWALGRWFVCSAQIGRTWYCMGRTKDEAVGKAPKWSVCSIDDACEEAVLRRCNADSRDFVRLIQRVFSR